MTRRAISAGPYTKTSSILFLLVFAFALKMEPISARLTVVVLVLVVGRGLLWVYWGCTKSALGVYQGVLAHYEGVTSPNERGYQGGTSPIRGGYQP